MVSRLAWVVLLLAAPAFLHAGAPPAQAPPAQAEFRYPEGTCGAGELKYTDGLPVLTVAGTPEEIGTQVGTLALKPAQRILDFPQDFIRLGLQGKKLNPKEVIDSLVYVGRMMAVRFPPRHYEEMKAMAKASGVDVDLIILGNTIDDIERIAGCSSLAVLPSRSKTGGMLLARNLDYPTLGYLHEYSLVTVYRPKGRLAFASVGLPGFAGVLSGMNVKGLALVVHDVVRSADKSAPFNPFGSPLMLNLRRVLEECATVAEAEKLMRGVDRTTYMNVTVCDTKDAAVFEFTPQSFEVRRPTDGLVACTNHFRSDRLCVGKECWRFPILEAAGQSPRLGVDELWAKLDAVNQKGMTFQSMVFEPAALKMHLGFGVPPSSSRPPHTLELRPLFEPEGE